VQFEVTQQIIDTAKPRDSGHCMIADAVKAAIPGAAHVSVDLATIRFSDRKIGKRYVYLTPASAQQALVAFDQGAEISPFRFRMRQAQVTDIVASAHKGRPNSLERPVRAPRATIGNATRSADVADKNMPVKIGGQLPPVAVLSNARGRIRQFGIRQLRP
jgi:hypothetical protein